MECGICNAIKKWLTKKDDKGDKDDMTDFNALLIMNDKRKWSKLSLTSKLVMKN